MTDDPLPSDDDDDDSEEPSGDDDDDDETELSFCQDPPYLDSDTIYDATPTVVGTAYGKIQGQIVGGPALSGETYAFKGIPYAAPPVGALRWKPPQEPSPFSSTWDASYFRPACAQNVPNPSLGAEDPMSEDCLYLNVFVPRSIESGEQLPVAIWIHGGSNAFSSGEKTFHGIHPKFANIGKLIFVTINYRLGTFGGLAHPALSAEDPNGSSGNYLVLDQLAAADWVKRNISNFGGDPNKVLLFGGSGGSIDTWAHFASPLSGDCFDAIGMQSWPAAAAQASYVEGFQGQVIAEEANCENAPDVAACLRALSTEEILTIQANTVNAELLPTFFNPKIDGWFLPDHPLQMIMSGLHNHKPVFAGNQTRDTFKFPGFGVANEQDFDDAVTPLLLEAGVNDPVEFAEKLAELKDIHYPLGVYGTWEKRL